MKSAPPWPMQANGEGAKWVIRVSGMAARLCQIGSRGLILVLRQRRAVINSGCREL